MTDSVELKPFNSLIFEPHSGYGGLDPEGEPWPIGYVSEGVGKPLLEITGMNTPASFYPALAQELVTAWNTRTASQGEVAELVEALEAAYRVLLPRRGDDEVWAVMTQIFCALSKHKGAGQQADGAIMHHRV